MAQVGISAFPTSKSVTSETTEPGPQVSLGRGWVGALHLGEIWLKAIAHKRSRPGLE